MRYYEMIARRKGEFWKDDKYQDYKMKHGEHFTEELAAWASGKMKNVSGEAHTWTTDQVRAAFGQLGLTLPKDTTWGDATYAANMAYADYFGKSLYSEADCIRHAHAELADPDGYPSKTFSRWLADNMGLGIDVDWAKFV